MFAQTNKDWDEAPAHILLAYESSIHETAGFTSNLLFIGREIFLPLDLIYTLTVYVKMPQPEYARDTKLSIQLCFDIARKYLFKNQIYENNNTIRRYMV